MQRFFKKELLSNRLYAKSTGAPIPFENVGDDTGIIATDNQALIDELDQAVSKGIGGVVVIDEAECQELKKKALANPSLNNLLRDRFSVSALNLLDQSNQGARVAIINNNPVPIRHSGLSPNLIDLPKEVPDPIQVTTEFSKPRTARPFFKKASG